MNPKKVTIILLLNLILSTTCIFLNSTSALSSEEQKLKAETLLNILDTVNASITEAKGRLAAQNIPVPPTAETNYNEGIAHAEEAANLMNIENYAAASAEAVEAMQNFKETLIILQEASPAEPTETEVTAEMAINLRANITRAYEYVERLENLTAKARTARYNTTVIAAIDNKLSLAKEHLENATRELNKLNLDGAAEQLRVAGTLLEESKESWDILVNLVKISDTEKYLEAARARVSASKENITQSTGLSAQNKTEAISALDNSESNLENASDLIKSGMVDDAIGKLEEAKKWEDESRQYLPPSVTATPTSQAEAVDKNSQGNEAARSK